jgi:uncharacterized protein YjbI with pentapeptide repeats
MQGYSESRDTDLTDADLGDANLENANLLEAKLVGANLSATILTNVKMYDTDLRFVNFEPKTLPEVREMASASNLQWLCT